MFYRTPEIVQRSTVHSNPAMFTSLYHVLHAGGAVRIGFLGGSITEGAGATSRDRRYSTLLVQYLDSLYPSSFVEINAGRGATDSLTGVFRLDRDLLDSSPNLVILDYGVNDWGLPEQRVAYENVIRRILARKIAVLSIFLMTDTGENQQSWQADLCRRYGVPAVSYRDAYYPMIQDGTIAWSELAADYVHPNDLGHELIAFLLSEHLTGALSQEPPALNSAMPPVLYGTDFLTTTVYQHGDDTATLLGSEGWNVEQGALLNYFGGDAISAEAPGSSYRLSFEGTSLAINYSRLNDPRHGMVDVYVDGELRRTLDAYSSRALLVQQSDVIARGLHPGTHTVEVRISPQRNPAATGHYFRLMAFLFGHG
ncbi:MAG: GDSL-type esterase/lipase family protein [Anaerolineae bacterium]|nr:GDSL-type esterase/lipase family protein [Anaerolineae bacterium]